MSSLIQDDDNFHVVPFQVEYPGSYVDDFKFQNNIYENDEPEVPHGTFLSNEQKPKILLMGMRRSGKSSIQNVVFHKMSPMETSHLAATQTIVTDDIASSSFVRFTILDIPAQVDFFEPSFDSERIFGGHGSLVFVIDAEDDYAEALHCLQETIIRAYKINPKLNFEVFIHKVDGMTEEHRTDAQKNIPQRAKDDLCDNGMDHINLNFYSTSIFDHSIFQAFSKVVQKLIPQLTTLEGLLNLFITNSGIEKAFLFDVWSKIYIATDTSPVDMQTYELCCDMIDVVLDISHIYGQREDEEEPLADFDTDSCSIIKMNNNTILYLREVSKYLALVCIIKSHNYEKPISGIVNYNFLCIRDALTDVLADDKKPMHFIHHKVKIDLDKKKLCSEQADLGI